MIGQILALHPPATAALVSAYKQALAGKEPAPAGPRPYRLLDDVAVVGIKGFMAKASSPIERIILWLLGGTDTAAAREAVLEAGDDAHVRAVLLHVNSPGGFVTGTDDLARAVAQVRERKLVIGYIEDLGASAAYYVASQADRIAVNPSGLTGSIGTYSVLYDLSGAAAAEGVKVIVVSSAELKGSTVAGAPVSAAATAETQRLVNGINDQFVAAVARGRRVPEATARGWATGQVHFAEDARRLGLVDAIAGFDQALYAARTLRTASAAIAVSTPRVGAHGPYEELEAKATAAGFTDVVTYCKTAKGADDYRTYRAALLAQG